MNSLTKNMLLFPFNLLYKASPPMTLSILFRLKQGYRLNLKEPKTYNQKLQWIKLHDCNPLMPRCCDKYLVREYVAEQGCSHILNHLIWEGVDPIDIPFESLPEKFVIKVTHGSTFNIICVDRAKIDKEDVMAKCRMWLKAKFLPCYGEWFYGIENPRIIVESYIDSDEEGQLKDYKVFCFHGVPRYIKVDSNRFTNHSADMYDCNWNYVADGSTGFELAGDVFPRPSCLEELLDYAARLSKPFLHARVDFYIVGQKIIFGEITFTSGAGFDRFASYKFDVDMGKWLVLPTEAEKEKN